MHPIQRPPGSTGAPRKPLPLAAQFLGLQMSDLSPSLPRSRRLKVTVESLSVSPRVAGEMLGFAKTKIAELVSTRELESYVDRGARRILTASIHDYIARKVEATKAPASRGPSRSRHP
jgi:hypothetical protein